MNTFVFDKAAYKSDTLSYWEEISYFLQVLTKNGYHCSLHGEDGDEVVVVEYDYAAEEIADKYLYWLDLEEATYIDDKRHMERETDNGSF